VEEKKKPEANEKTKNLEKNIISGFSSAFAGINKQSILKGAGTAIEKTKELAGNFMTTEQKEKAEKAKLAVASAGVASKLVV
jgi:hypothetical protein